jgi:signal transduction histidine kinase
VQLVWDVPLELPIVWSDPAKLKVALKNLIANAIKFTDAGSVTVRVTVNEDEVEFTVADSGVGISPEALPIIFEAFRQADSSSTRRFGGVGLGLYIVRRLLDLLGGRVEVESRLGQGSTFRIRLPRSAPSS